MNYDITKTSAPSMPNLGKGSKSIQISLFQAPKRVLKPLVPMLFPLFGASFLNAKIQQKGPFRKVFCTKHGLQHAKTSLEAR